MRVRLVLVVENDSPVEALGDAPEQKIKAGWELLLRTVELVSENGDKGYVEAVEILSDKDQ